MYLSLVVQRCCTFLPTRGVHFDYSEQILDRIFWKSSMQNRDTSFARHVNQTSSVQDPAVCKETYP